MYSKHSRNVNNLANKKILVNSQYKKIYKSVQEGQKENNITRNAVFENAKIEIDNTISMPEINRVVSKKYLKPPTNTKIKTKTQISTELGSKLPTLRETIQKINEQLSSSLMSQSDTSHECLALLSQPTKEISHRKRLEWLQERRGNSLWVECVLCLKWRWLEYMQDPLDVPKQWKCSMNKDETYSSCDVLEQPISSVILEDVIHNSYTAGSIVWVKAVGLPWWPGMVDDCPDLEQYYWIEGYSTVPSQYNVTFFDSKQVARCWVPIKHLKPYKNMINPNVNFPGLRNFHKRIAYGEEQARKALKMPIKERLKKYSFLTCYPGEIITPPESDDDSMSSRVVSLHNYFGDISDCSDILDENSNIAPDSTTDDEPLLKRSRIVKRKKKKVLWKPKKWISGQASLETQLLTFNVKDDQMNDVSVNVFRK